MNKYFEIAIALISTCSIGLATISIAEDSRKQSNTVEDIQLQSLDDSLTARLQSLETTPPTIPQKIAPQPVSVTAINIVKEFEGFESQAYVDTDGTPVIGYGLSKIAGKPVQIGDRISPEQADAALNTQLQEIQQELDKAISVEISDRQLSAITSLSFNVGVDFIEESTLVRKLNTGDYNGAANEFLRWDKANVRGQLVQMAGLTRRRQAERTLFLHLNN